jgi:hypothetical protein
MGIVACELHLGTLSLLKTECDLVVYTELFNVVPSAFHQLVHRRDLLSLNDWFLSC